MIDAIYMRVSRLRLFMIAAAAALAVHAAPASAQDARQDMAQAISNCISNYRMPENVESAFRQTGFTLDSDVFGPFARKGEIFVYYDQAEDWQGNSSCSIFTGAVGLHDAHGIALDVANQLFPDGTHDGPPEVGRDDCLAVSVFAPRKLMVLRVFDNGNGGTCTGQDGSSIGITF